MDSIKPIFLNRPSSLSGLGYPSFLPRNTKQIVKQFKKAVEDATQNTTPELDVLPFEK